MTNERCDYIRIRCMKAYTTGAICARTIDYQYHSFDNYCAMEFHNCVARFDNVWSIAYTGYCTPLVIEKSLYVDMTYDQMSNNTKLKQMYVADLGDDTEFEGYATYPSTVLTTTVQYEIHNVTDENGTVVTDPDGNAETQWAALLNVTDENGTEVTDQGGNFKTEWVTVTNFTKNNGDKATTEAITEAITEVITEAINKAY
ncbi:uncharacterized protein LOC134750797 [Cydia strobilella]|uniref:uncharacterized protein LOC134750797 n=1 Tax=Cydia strobilella TaxID=1100964 RepID=UPI00300409EF